MENIITSPSPPPARLSVAGGLAGSSVAFPPSSSPAPVQTWGHGLLASLHTPPRGTLPPPDPVALLQGAASNGNTGSTVFAGELFDWVFRLSAGVIRIAGGALSPFEPGAIRLLFSGAAAAEIPSIEKTPLPLSLLSPEFERSALRRVLLGAESLGLNKETPFDESSVSSAIQMVWQSLRASAELSCVVTKDAQMANSVTGLRTVDSGPLPLLLFHAPKNLLRERESGRESAATSDYLNEARRQPYETEESKKTLEKSTRLQMFEPPKNLVGRVVGFLRALFAQVAAEIQSGILPEKTPEPRKSMIFVSPRSIYQRRTSTGE